MDSAESAGIAKLGYSGSPRLFDGSWDIDA